LGPGCFHPNQAHILSGLFSDEIRAARRTAGPEERKEVRRGKSELIFVVASKWGLKRTELSILTTKEVRRMV
jgi:hypothetical protein